MRCVKHFAASAVSVVHKASKVHAANEEKLVRRACEVPLALKVHKANAALKVCGVQPESPVIFRLQSQRRSVKREMSSKKR